MDLPNLSAATFVPGDNGGNVVLVGTVQVSSVTAAALRSCLPCVCIPWLTYVGAAHQPDHESWHSSRVIIACGKRVSVAEPAQCDAMCGSLELSFDCGRHQQAPYRTRAAAVL